MSIDNQGAPGRSGEKIRSGVISDPITVNPDMTIRKFWS